jgi:hypothetical protein
MAIQKWEYCSLTIDHYDEGDNRQSVTFVHYSMDGTSQRAISPDDFGRFVAQLGLESWELAGVSSDQPAPPGAHYRESWVFKRLLKEARR